MITTELYQTEKSMEKALKKETSGDIAVFGDERSREKVRLQLKNNAVRI